MFTVSASEVKNSMLMDLFAKRHLLVEQIHQFSVRHKLAFPAFERKVRTAKTERFNEWDDYMEWKSCERQLREIETHINDMKHGRFKVS